MADELKRLANRATEDDEDVLEKIVGAAKEFGWDGDDLPHFVYVTLQNRKLLKKVFHALDVGRGSRKPIEDYLDGYADSRVVERIEELKRKAGPAQIPARRKARPATVREQAQKAVDALWEESQRLLRIGSRREALDVMRTHVMALTLLSELSDEGYG